MTMSQLFKYSLQVHDHKGNVLESGCKVTVYTVSTTTAATIYGDAAGTAKTNPITTTVFAADDAVEFWLAAASCDVVVEYNGRRSVIAALTPSSQHNIIIDTERQDLVVCHGIVFEFDCAEAAVTNVIIPAAENPRGLIITHVFGIITEAMVGSSQDQGIVTVSDESDNTICTLTPSDAAADAIGDYILGFQAQSTATGTAGKVVAAGEYVDAVVTQATAGGTPAGKYKVYVEYIRL